MTQQKESVVTPERFAQGASYEDWMRTVDRNQARFEENFAGTKVSEADAAALKALVQSPEGPARCLALGEAWCPDVFRGLPVMARLCEATGLELKIFFRDQNLDIMNEFLYNGEFQSIPTFVFYTQAHEYLGHWIERAKKAREEQPLLQEITGRMRNPDLTPEERQKYMDEYTAFQCGPTWDGWRQAQVREMIALIEEALG